MPGAEPAADARDDVVEATVICHIIEMAAGLVLGVNLVVAIRLGDITEFEEDLCGMLKGRGEMGKMTARDECTT